MATLALAAASAVGFVWLNHELETVSPTLPAPDLTALFFDRTPVTIAYTVHGHAFDWHTTADGVRGSLTLWRRLHLAE